MSRARHLRIIFEPGTSKPWLVQYSTNETQTWTDVYRFTEPDEAVTYVEDVAARDRVLLEAER